MAFRTLYAFNSLYSVNFIFEQFQQFYVIDFIMELEYDFTS